MGPRSRRRVRSARPPRGRRQRAPPPKDLSGETGSRQRRASEDSLAWNSTAAARDTLTNGGGVTRQRGGGRSRLASDSTIIGRAPSPVQRRGWSKRSEKPNGA